MNKNGGSGVNSTVLALVIYVLLMYDLMCMYNKIELLNAAVISIGIFIMAFMALSGILSVNKALALLLILVVFAAAFMLFRGRKPGHGLSKKMSIPIVLLRDTLFMALVFAAWKCLTYAQTKSPDALSVASQSFNEYLWCVIWLAAVATAAVDLVIHAIGYTRAGKLGEKLYPVAAFTVIAVGILTTLLKAANTGNEGLLTAIIVIIAIFIAGWGLAGLYKNKDIIELAFLAAAEFVLTYILSAGLLITVNYFSIRKALTFTVILLLIADIIIYAVRKQKPCVTFSWKRSLFGLVISLLVLPLGFSTFGFYGMGQDEGVYQAKAIGYIYGYNDNYVSFDEYDKLESQQEKERYMQVLGNDLAGYNFALSEEKTSLAGSDVSLNDTLGNLHGIHTFSALLGLYGTIAGVENMLGLGSIILMLSAFIMWLILTNLKVNNLYKGIAVLLYITSPQILWQARTSLVETTLGFIIITFIYLITDKKNENYRWLSWLPVAAFSYFHITIYVFMPLFVLIQYGLYFASGKRRYMTAAALSVAAYLGGFYMMYTSSLTYVYGNYDRLYIGGIGTDNIHKLVTAVSVAAILFTLIIAAFPLKKRKKFCKKSPKCKIIWRILVTILAVAAVAGCAYVKINSVYPFSYLTGYAYMLSSGIIMIPIIMLAAFIKPEIFRKNSSIVVLSAMFYYCVIIYSVIFKTEVLHYYYYGRYIVPYISVIVILGACVMQYVHGDLLSRKRSRVRNVMQAGVAFAAMLAAAVLLPYAAVVATQQDQTQVQWSVLTDITESIEETSAVIVCNDVNTQLLLPLKYMTKADIYTDTQDLQSQIYSLSAKYDKVYVVTGELEAQSLLTEHLDRIYHNDNKIQTDVKMPEELSGIQAFIPYAEEFEAGFKPIEVYQYLSES